MSGLVFKVVVIEQVTERVWYEVTGVGSEQEAIVAYQSGEGAETYRKHISTDYCKVEEVYQEKQYAQPADRPPELKIRDRDGDEKDPCDPDKSEVPDLETLMEWEAEGGCEATDGCWVEPDGVCPHDCRSWLLEFGLI